jgi:hypothetical protein
MNTRDLRFHNDCSSASEHVSSVHVGSVIIMNSVPKAGLVQKFSLMYINPCVVLYNPGLPLNVIANSNSICVADE